MADLKEYLQQKGYTKSSIKSYIYAVGKFTAWAEQNQVDSEYASYTELLSYVQSLRERQVNQRTVQSYMIALNHYYESLIKAKIIEINPAKYIEIKTKQTRPLYQILSKEQLENLHSSFDIRGKRKTKATAELSAIRNKVATGLMVFQGLDTNVLSSLSTADINVLSGSIYIKGSSVHNSRTLALQATQIIELDRYNNQTRKELQEHFKQEESELLLITGYSKYNDAHKKLMHRLRKQEPKLQSVQHIKTSVITHWLKQYSLREVQHMAGHRHVHSTEAYRQNDTEGLQMDIDRFHPMNE